MKNIFKLSVVLLASVSMVSCFDKTKPNYQYFPDMYEPVGYETYGEYDIFKDGQEAKLPVDGSIPRGWQPYDYEDTQEGKAKATAELKNPLPTNEENLAAGNRLYTIFCAVCHGDNGDGKGILATREKFLGIPSYADAGRNITEGGIYHVQMYGLNSMGSYASQTNEKERWQITQHVLQLKASLEGKATPAETGEESTATDAPQSGEGSMTATDTASEEKTN